MKVQEVRQFIRHGRLDEALELIDELRGSQFLPGLILKSRVLERKGQYVDAFLAAEQALQLSNKEGRRLEEVGARIARAYALLRLYRFDTMKQEVKDTRHLLGDIGYDYRQVKQYEATLYNILGIYHRLSGNLDRAMQNYEISLSIRSKLNLAEEIAISLTNIGTVCQIKGELEDALRYHQEALVTFEELGDDLFVASCLHDIGHIYWQKGNLQQSKTYYEQAVEKRISNHHETRAAQSLFELIRLMVDCEEQDAAERYFEQLEKLYLQSSQPKPMEVFYHLAEATLLKHNSRIIERAKAQNIFLQYYKKEQLDFQYAKYAMLNLCDLLIMDLKISKDELLIQEVEDILEQLYALATVQHLNLLKIETYHLQAKLALVKLNLERAQKKLNMAENLARDIGLEHIAQSISLEHDKMMDRLGRWDNLKKRNASIIERIEAVNLKGTIDNLLTPRQQQIIEQKKEIPQFVQILNDDAITLYSHTFSPQIEINEQLIGGFLMATNFRINQAFDRLGQTIERIKYGKYNMIFMKYRRITFCYAFEGQSYYAVQRLSGFIDRIKLSRSWDLFDEKVPQPKKIKNEIHDKVEAYFLGPTIFS